MLLLFFLRGIYLWSHVLIYMSCFVIVLNMMVFFVFLVRYGDSLDAYLVYVHDSEVFLIVLSLVSQRLFGIILFIEFCALSTLALVAPPQPMRP